MRNVKQRSMGFEINKPYIETTAELAEAMGVTPEVAEVKVWDLVNQQYSVHNWLVKLRTEVTKALGEEIGVERAHEVDADGKKSFKETEGQHLARIEEKADEDNIVLTEAYADKVQEIADGIAYDFKATARGTGSSAKPAKKWLGYVDAIVERGKLEVACEKYGIAVALDEDNKPTEATTFALATAIKVEVTEKAKAAEQGALAGL